ncbi:hypothetical protein D3C72_1764460 [compost metagenome]
MRDMNAILAKRRKHGARGLFSEKFEFYALIGSKAFFGSGYQHGAVDSRRKSCFYPMPFRQTISPFR